jgi:hypothetical protein
LRCAYSGTGSPASGKPGVEVLECLLEAYLGRVELAHRDCEPVFGEVLGVDAARLGDEFHGAH